jgi:hypothetical protein
MQVLLLLLLLIQKSLNVFCPRRFKHVMLSPILPVNPLNLIQVVPISHSAMGTISIDLIGRPNIDFVRPKRAVNAKEWAGFR